MADNALQLKNFYDSAKGHKQCRIIREKIMRRWPYISKERIIGFGFTLPYLPMFTTENNVLALTTQTLGALDMHQGILSVMADEAQLPLRNEVIDKIIAAHALENAADANELLFEFWRVLKPYGKILFIFEPEKFELSKITGMLLANKFNIIYSKPAGFFNKTHIIEAQKLIFAPRGRTQKIVKSFWDKLTRPKRVMEPT